MSTVVDQIDHELTRIVEGLDVTPLQQRYIDQGEMLTLPQFFPPPVINQFMDEVNRVRPFVNRNYIPTHKKGGSVSYYLLREHAPSIISFYQSPAFIRWLSRLTGVSLLLCPDDDPHACALYFYTEPGDHIGFHYDTSYYKGDRYTVLLGLTDRSTSRLLCRLHTKNPERETTEMALATDPGLLVVFNGDTLYHAVTPIEKGEERIVLTLQYVTDPDMGTFKRWFSNMKDAVGYFGLSALFRKPG